MKSPEIFTKMIEKAYRNKLPYAYIFALSVYVIYSIIYYSLSFWMFRKSIQKAIYSLIIFLFTKKKVVLVRSNIRTRYLNGLNFIFSWKTLIVILPFCFAFYDTVWLQYKKSFFVKNFSIFFSSDQKLSWQTFEQNYLNSGFNKQQDKQNRQEENQVSETTEEAIPTGDVFSPCYAQEDYSFVISNGPYHSTILNKLREEKSSNHFPRGLDKGESGIQTLFSSKDSSSYGDQLSFPDVGIEKTRRISEKSLESKPVFDLEKAKSLFLNKIDVYDDFLFLKLDTLWETEKTEVFSGYFKKKSKFNDSSKCPSIGTEWYQIFSYQAENWKSSLDSRKTKFPVLPVRSKDSTTLVEGKKESGGLKNEKSNQRTSLLTNTRQWSKKKSTNDSFSVLSPTFKFFSSNLDELPKKVSAFTPFLKIENKNNYLYKKTTFLNPWFFEENWNQEVAKGFLCQNKNNLERSDKIKFFTKKSWPVFASTWKSNGKKVTNQFQFLKSSSTNLSKYLSSEAHSLPFSSLPKVKDSSRGNQRETTLTEFQTSSGSESNFKPSTGNVSSQEIFCFPFVGMTNSKSVFIDKNLFFKKLDQFSISDPGSFFSNKKTTLKWYQQNIFFPPVKEIGLKTNYDFDQKLFLKSQKLMALLQKHETLFSPLFNNQHFTFESQRSHSSLFDKSKNSKNLKSNISNPIVFQESNTNTPILQSQRGSYEVNFKNGNDSFSVFSDSRGKSNFVSEITEGLAQLGGQKKKEESLKSEASPVRSKTNVSNFSSPLFLKIFGFENDTNLKVGPQNESIEKVLIDEANTQTNLPMRGALSLSKVELTDNQLDSGEEEEISSLKSADLGSSSSLFDSNEQTTLLFEKSKTNVEKSKNFISSEVDPSSYFFSHKFKVLQNSFKYLLYTNKISSIHLSKIDLDKKPLHTKQLTLSSITEKKQKDNKIEKTSSYPSDLQEGQKRKKFKTKLNLEFLPRTMSGYNCPDLIKEEIQKLILKQKDFTFYFSGKLPIFDLKIERPTIFLTPSRISFFQLPKIKLMKQSVSLPTNRELKNELTEFGGDFKQGNTSQTFQEDRLLKKESKSYNKFLETNKSRYRGYKGIGVAQDIVIKDVIFKNEFALREWMEESISIDNPSFDKKETLQNESLTVFIKKKKKKLNQISQNFLYTLETNYEKPVPILESTETWQVRQLNQNEWLPILEKIKKSIAETEQKKQDETSSEAKETNGENTLNSTFPVLPVRRKDSKTFVGQNNRASDRKSKSDSFSFSNSSSFSSAAKGGDTFGNEATEGLAQLGGQKKKEKGPSFSFVRGVASQPDQDDFEKEKQKGDKKKPPDFDPTLCSSLLTNIQKPKPGIFGWPIPPLDENILPREYQREFTNFWGPSSCVLNTEVSSFKEVSLARYVEENRKEKEEIQINFKYFVKENEKKPVVRFLKTNWEDFTIGFLLILALSQISFGVLFVKSNQWLFENTIKPIIHQLILFFYFFGLIETKLKKKIEIQLELDKTNKGYQLFQPKKSLENFIGIDQIYPESNELIKFFKKFGNFPNFFYSFFSLYQIPKGVLLTGPPGTGKTLLVQVIAGEAKIPILFQSASDLTEIAYSEHEISILRLTKLYRKARRIAPCLVFIDEIDTLGDIGQNYTRKPGQFLEKLPYTEKKGLHQFLMQSQAMDNFSGDSSLSRVNTKKKWALQRFLIIFEKLKKQNNVLLMASTNRVDSLDFVLTKKFEQILTLSLPNKRNRIQILKLYSQNLGTSKPIYWDYFAQRTVGLSSAYLSAAMNESAIQAILENTAHTMKTIDKGIETVTFADFNKKQKKIKNRAEKNKNKKSGDSFLITRLAFYKAGKGVLHSLLPDHPPVTILSLWSSEKKRQTEHIQFLKRAHRTVLETRLIGFYAGKAGELLTFQYLNQILHFSIAPLEATGTFSMPSKGKITFLKKKVVLIAKAHSKATTHNMEILNSEINKLKQQFNKISYWNSNSGSQDLKNGSQLAFLMIQNWLLYSRTFLINNLKWSQKNLDPWFLDEKNLFPIRSQIGVSQNTTLVFQKKVNKRGSSLRVGSSFKQVTLRSFYAPFSFDASFDKKFGVSQFFQSTTDENQKISLLQEYQNWSQNSWWQTQVVKEIDRNKPKSGSWFRILLFDPSENQYNQSWVPPDSFYHKNNYLKSISKSKVVTWNTLSQINQEYLYHSLVLISFNKAFSILNQNRELLDYLAHFLLKKEIIRQYELTPLLEVFCKNISILTKIEKVLEREKSVGEKLKKGKKVLLENHWELQYNCKQENYKVSRRKPKRFLKFFTKSHGEQN